MDVKELAKITSIRITETRLAALEALKNHFKARSVTETIGLVIDYAYSQIADTLPTKWGAMPKSQYEEKIMDLVRTHARYTADPKTPEEIERNDDIQLALYYKNLK